MMTRSIKALEARRSNPREYRRPTLSQKDAAGHRSLVNRRLPILFGACLAAHKTLYHVTVTKKEIDTIVRESEAFDAMTLEDSYARCIDRTIMLWASGSTI